MEPKLIAYLDHSAFNALEKGRHKNIRNLFEEEQLLLGFSHETIGEIVRGAHHKYGLQLLTAANSWLIQSEHLINGSDRYDPTFKKVDLDKYIKTVEREACDFSKGGFGLFNLHQKFMGGLRGLSLDDIRKSALSDFEKVSHINQGQILEFETALNQAFDLLQKQNLDLLFNPESIYGTSPKTLNNIKQPNALEQIISQLTMPLEEIHRVFPIPVDHATAASLQFSDNTVFEAVMFLNMIGFQREGKLLKDKSPEKDYIGAISDAYHIAFSRHCNYFYTSDKKQAEHATVIFEHLNVKTIVVLLNQDSDKQSYCYKPDSLNIYSFPV